MEKKENNYGQLCRQLQFSGFGRGLNDDLKTLLDSGADFELPYVRQFGKDQVQATLFFGHDENGKYYFNRFSISVYSEGETTPQQQTYYISRSFVQFTFLEGYNLLKGRSVFKAKVGAEGMEGPAWLRLNNEDVNQYGNRRFHIYNEPRYGYNLAGELAQFPIQGLSDEENVTKLLRSLEKGNRCPVKLLLNGKELAYAIEALPEVRSIEFYDNNDQKISISTVLS